MQRKLKRLKNKYELRLKRLSRLRQPLLGWYCARRWYYVRRCCSAWYCYSYQSNAVVCRLPRVWTIHPPVLGELPNIPANDVIFQWFGELASARHLNSPENWNKAGKTDNLHFPNTCFLHSHQKSFTRRSNWITRLLSAFELSKWRRAKYISSHPHCKTDSKRGCCKIDE